MDKLKNMINKNLIKCSIAALSAMVIVSCNIARPGTPYSPDTNDSGRKTVNELANNSASLFALLLSPTNNQMDLLDLADNRVKLSVTTGRNPSTISVSNDKNHILVLNQLDKTVSSFYRLDNQNITDVGTIGIGGELGDVIFNNTGTEAYVTNQSLGRIAVLTILNRDRPKIKETLSLRSEGTDTPQPTRMAISSDNNTLYVIDKPLGRLFVFQKTNDTWSQKNIITISDNNQKSVLEDIVINKDILYISDSNNGRVVTFDTKTNAVTGSISLANADVKGDTLPSKMVVNPDATKLYVINEGTSSVGVINLSNNTLSKHIFLSSNSNTDSSGPTGISITSNGQTIYVTNNVGRNLSIISAKDDTLLRNIGTSQSSSALLPLSDIKIL